MRRVLATFVVAVLVFGWNMEVAYAATTTWNGGSGYCLRGTNGTPAFAQTSGDVLRLKSTGKSEPLHSNCGAALSRGPGQIRIQMSYGYETPSGVGQGIVAYTPLYSNQTTSTSMSLDFKPAWSSLPGAGFYQTISNHEVLIYGTFEIKGTLVGDKVYRG
jgi:hypothetical protein